MSPCELKVLNRVSNFVRKNFKRSGGGEGTVGSRILYFDIFMSLMNTGLCFNIVCTVQRWVLSSKKLKVLTKPVIRIEDLVVRRLYAQSNRPL